MNSLRRTRTRELEGKTVIALLASLVVWFGGESTYAAPSPSNALHDEMNTEQLDALAKEVYLYAYPLVIMDITRQQVTNVPNANTVPMRAPINEFAHFREYPGAESREVVRFNFDTLYSFAWVDLTREPLMLSVPEMHGRYYLLPMLDMWTDVFAVPGTRTTGSEAQRFLLAAPSWKGEVPENTQLIRAPTPIIWIMGRTQTNGPSDFSNVHSVQDAYTLTPLSKWGNPDVHPSQSMPVDPNLDNDTPPLVTVNQMSGVELLTHFSDLLKSTPPHASDYPILHRMQALGLHAGETLDVAQLSDSEIERLNAAAISAKQELAQLLRGGALGETRNGWNYALNLGNYGIDYRLRALVAMAGLGANLGHDAIYPNAIADANGNPTSGENNYTIHFTKDRLPPANAFWSLTMYDHEGFQVANPINRFAIGDRDPLVFNNDGSLDIHIQHEPPGAEQMSNWLPAPEGPFQVMMRIYSPEDSVFSNGLDLPPIKKSN